LRSRHCIRPKPHTSSMGLLLRKLIAGGIPCSLLICVLVDTTRPGPQQSGRGPRRGSSDRQSSCSSSHVYYRHQPQPPPLTDRIEFTSCVVVA
jgi:hypothetical protein